MYYLLPDIGNIIKGVFVTVLEWIQGVFIGAFEALVSGLKDIVISAPYPNDSSGNPVIFNPQNAAQTGDLNGVWYKLLNPAASGANFYDETVVPIAVLLFLLAFSLAYVAKIFEGMPAVAQFQPDLSKVFFLFIVTLTWLPIMTGALAVSDAVGNILGNAGSVTGGNVCNGASGDNPCNDSGGTSSSALISVLLGIILFLAATLMMLFGALLWAFRYLLLFTLGVTMPIILAFKAFEEVDLPFVEDFADMAWELFWFAAFANIPAALVFLVGNVVADVASNFGGNLLGDIMSIMIKAALPLVAIFAPFYFLKNTQAGSTVVQTTSSVAGGVADAGAAVASGGTTAAVSGLSEAASDLADEDKSKKDAVKSGVAATGVNALNEMTDENSAIRKAWQGQRRARNAAGALGAASRGEDPEEALGQDSYLEKYDRTGDYNDPEEMEDEDVSVAGEFADVIGSGAQFGRQARVDSPAGDDIERMMIEDEDEKIEQAKKIGYDSNDLRTFERRLAREGLSAEDLLNRGYDGEYASELRTARDTSMGADDIQAIREYADIDEVSKENLANNARDLVQNDDVLDAVGGRDELESFIEEAQEQTIKQSLSEAGEQINLEEEEVDQIVENTSASTMSDLADMDPERLASEVPWGIDENRAEGIVGYAQQEMVLEQLNDQVKYGDSVSREVEDTIRQIVGTGSGYDIGNAKELAGKYAAAGGDPQEFIEEAGGGNISDLEAATFDDVMEDAVQQVEREVEAEQEVTPGGSDEVEEALDVSESAAREINRETGSRYSGSTGSTEDLFESINDDTAERVEELSRELKGGKIGRDIVLEARKESEAGNNVSIDVVRERLEEEAEMDPEDAERLASLAVEGGSAEEYGDETKTVDDILDT